MSTKFGSRLINKSIPSLFNGVSQQAASLRLDSQSEDEENAYPALVEGNYKRPPSTHLAKLNTETSADNYIHFINRDTVERYVVFIKNGDLKVYDLTGTEMTVTFTASKTYLNATTPRTSFAVVTIADFTFIVNKSIATAMTADVTAGTLAGTDQDFDDLPTSPTTGDIRKIEGDPSNNFDNYYVKFNGDAWEECALPNILNTFDGTTMPHKLVRTGVNTFEFDVVTWTTRLIGDDDSNPKPTFIGNKLNDIFLHKNRLGLLSGENCIMTSTPSSDFNFWRETATTLIDSDPIDVAASHTKVSTLHHAIPFDKTLLLFSEQTQFLLSSANVLSPKTVSIDVTTQFETSADVSPVGAGANVYFTVPSGDNTSLYEYYVEDEVVTNDASEITSHIPTYIPKNVFQIEASSNEDVIFTLTSEDRNHMYVYKYFWQGNEKVQSAWSRWTFDSTDTILGIKIIETDLFVVVKRADGTYLDKILTQKKLVDTGMPFLVLLDRKTEVTGVFDSGTNLTTWTLPYEFSGTVHVVLGTSFTGKVGQLVTSPSRPTNTTVTATGDFSAGNSFIGIPYTYKYTFSEQFLRDASLNPVRDGRLMIKHMNLNYTDSGFFTVDVTPKFRDTNTNIFTGQRLGSNLTVGTVNLLTGAFRFPIFSDAKGVTIEIKNDSHLPCVFQSAEWTALFHPLSQRS